jgi:hypothetical protein
LTFATGLPLGTLDGPRPHHQHEVALTDDLVDRVVADAVALGFELGECPLEAGEMMRVLSSDLGPATTARVEALGAHARVTYADWEERAKTRGEIASRVPTTVAAAFIDTQFTMLLVQMAFAKWCLTDGCAKPRP